MNWIRVLFILPLVVASALTARATGEPAGNGAPDAASVQTEPPHLQPVASQPGATGAGALRILARGPVLPGAKGERVKLGRKSAGLGFFRILGQGAGRPGADRKPASIGADRPRIIGEGIAGSGSGWKSATVGGQKQLKSLPARTTKPSLRQSGGR